MAKLLYEFAISIWRRYRLHLRCWTIFIAYEVFVTAILTGHLSPFINYVLFYTINIFTFYFQSEIILPKAKTDNGLSIGLVFVFQLLHIVLYCLLFMLVTILIRHFANTPAPATFFDQKYFAGILWRGIYFMLYGTAFYFFKEYVKKTKRSLQDTLEVERLNNLLLTTKQSYLRAQINPHLLFNSLSFIRHSVKTNAREADKAIMYLSEIMSFALNTDHEDSLFLSTEVEQINHIIKINQLRFRDRLFVDFDCNIQDSDLKITPLILLTLVENVFKHGELFEKNNPAKIKLSANDKIINFSTCNLISRKQGRPSGRLGLQNIEERLKLRYKNKFDFEYGVSGSMFNVQLNIYL